MLEPGLRNRFKSDLVALPSNECDKRLPDVERGAVALTVEGKQHIALTTQVDQLLQFCASGLLPGGFEDQPRDFVGMGDQREMAGLHLDGLGAHPLGHEVLKVRIDGAVFGGNGVEAGLGSPRRVRGLAGEQSLVERLYVKRSLEQRFGIRVTS